MDIESFDGHTLVAHRTSYSGGHVGVGQINGTAIYTGHISGTHITGTASYQPVGGPASVGPWCGEIENPKVLMPESLAAKQLPTNEPLYLLECELDQYCDGRWTFNGQSGNALWPRNPDVTADLTVESFTPSKIVIRRNDTAPNPFSAVYTGTLEGNHISGTVEARAGAQTATYNWTAIIPATSCVRADRLKLDTQEALDVGRIAFRFNLLPEALDCFMIGARNGDAYSQNAVAAVYYTGDSHIKQDYGKAFYWAGKSAAQDFYYGQKALSRMYARGIGTNVDPVKAQYWADKAAATPEGIEIAQNKARQALDQARQAQAQSMFNAFAGVLSGILGDGDSANASQQPPMNDAYHNCIKFSPHPSGCNR
jgi:hypothetical protein